jgi:hypothetical protein
MARSESSRRESEVASRSMLPKSHNRRQAYRVECNCTRMHCLIVDICTGTQCVLEKRLSSVYLHKPVHSPMRVWKPDCHGLRDFSVAEYVTDLKICLLQCGKCETSAWCRECSREGAPLSPLLLLPLHILTWSAAKSRGKPDNANFGDKTRDNPP